jgi:hypothetical protein
MSFEVIFESLTIFFVFQFILTGRLHVPADQVREFDLAINKT